MNGYQVATTASTSASGRFDYAAIPADKIAALRAQASRIRGFVTTQTSAVIEAGRDLLAVKDLLRGNFGQWVIAECGFSLATAGNYMRAAKFAEGRIVTVTILEPAVVYKLARKSTPVEIVDAVMARVMTGEIVQQREVLVMLEDVEHERREAEAKKRRPVVSARTQKKWAAEEQQRLERERLEKERIGELASMIIGTMGEEHARFLIDTVRPADAWDVFAVLRERVAPR